MEEKVLKTKNYEMFKSVLGNRDLIERNIQKKVDSMKEYGQITPIIVNEKYEIIDGQHRLEACKRLGIEVSYVIKPGLTPEYCAAANKSTENWKLVDYINFYTKRGNESYIRLSKLKEEFGDSLLISNICTALYGWQKPIQNVIANGKLEISEQLYNNTRVILKYTKDIVDQIDKKQLQGSLYTLGQSITLCYKFPEIDMGRLKKQVLKLYPTMGVYNNIDTCMIQLETVYNRGLNKNNKISIFALYKIHRVK